MLLLQGTVVVFTHWSTYMGKEELYWLADKEFYCEHYPMEFGFYLCLTNWVCMTLMMIELRCPMLQVMFVLKIIAHCCCCCVGWNGNENQQVNPEAPEAAPKKDVPDIA